MCAKEKETLVRARALTHIYVRIRKLARVKSQMEFPRELYNRSFKAGFTHDGRAHRSAFLAAALLSSDRADSRGDPL